MGVLPVRGEPGRLAGGRLPVYRRLDDQAMELLEAPAGPGQLAQRRCLALGIPAAPMDQRGQSAQAQVIRCRRQQRL